MPSSLYNNNNNIDFALGSKVNVYICNVYFSGCSEPGQSKTAFVTFKDPKALEIALLLSVFPLFVYLRNFQFVSL